MARNHEHFIENATAKWSDLRAAKTAMAQRYIHLPRAEAARRTQMSPLAAVRAATAAITAVPTDNVVGVGIGEKISDGKQTGALAVKFGRTTGYTVGKITSIDTDVTVGYDIGNLTFSEQIIIEANNGQSFSRAGDSGPLILERGTDEAVALLFAGSPSHTIANHIGAVLKALGVALA